MRVKLCGEVVSNGWARIYRFYGFEVCCPKDVRDAAASCPAGEELIFEINSAGGSVYAGFEMYSVIRGYTGGQTVAEVHGIAASSASVIMAACDRVLMSPVAEVMIHRATIPAEGNSAVMRQAKQMLDTVDDSILNAYVEKAGGKCDRETFRRMMRNETFMTAQQAIDCGLADAILDGAGGADFTSVAASMSERAAVGALPSIDDLLKLAAAAGVKLEDDGSPSPAPAGAPSPAGGGKGVPPAEAGGGAAAPECGRMISAPTVAGAAGGASPSPTENEYKPCEGVVNNDPGERSGEQEEDTNMQEINTVDELRQAYPDLVAQVEQEATAAERQRIRDISDMAMQGSEKQAEDAMFEHPVSAAEYAQAAMKRAKAQGGAWLAGVRRDAASAEGVKQETVTGQKSDEFLEAIRGVGKK